MEPQRRPYANHWKQAIYSQRWVGYVRLCIVWASDLNDSYFEKITQDGIKLEAVCLVNLAKGVIH